MNTLRRQGHCSSAAAFLLLVLPASTALGQSAAADIRIHLPGHAAPTIIHAAPTIPGAMAVPVNTNARAATENAPPLPAPVEDAPVELDETTAVVTESVIRAGRLPQFGIVTLTNPSRRPLRPHGTVRPRPEQVGHFDSATQTWVGPGGYDISGQTYRQHRVDPFASDPHRGAMLSFDRAANGPDGPNSRR